MRRVLALVVLGVLTIPACAPTPESASPTPSDGAAAGTSSSVLITTIDEAPAETAPGSQAPQQPRVTNCPVEGLPTTVAYDSIAGVPAESVSLDLHAPATRPCDAPVVMWVHGGGYQKGDKSQQVADKITLFNGRGWILVSVNYRLTVPGDPTSAHYPDHYNDVAASVAWVHGNIGRWGGDPDRVALLGHSAGADIVSNVITNPAHLTGEGVGLSAVRCAGPLDTEGFDKSAAAARSQSQWVEALGNNPNYLTDTSATLLATGGIGIPPTIGVVRGSAVRQQIQTAFLDKLDSIGVTNSRIDARNLTHNEVNRLIGAPGDTEMTPPLMAFLDSCLAE